MGGGWAAQAVSKCHATHVVCPLAEVLTTRLGRDLAMKRSRPARKRRVRSAAAPLPFPRLLKSLHGMLETSRPSAPSAAKKASSYTSSSAMSATTQRSAAAPLPPASGRKAMAL